MIKSHKPLFCFYLRSNLGSNLLHENICKLEKQDTTASLRRTAILVLLRLSTPIFVCGKAAAFR